MMLQGALRWPILFLVLSALLFACGGSSDEAPPTDEPDASMGDADPDAALDTTDGSPGDVDPVDVSPDARPDVFPDVVDDPDPHGAPDVPADVVPDVLPDTPDDVPSDTPDDVQPDTEGDATDGGDVQLDTEGDATDGGDVHEPEPGGDGEVRGRVTDLAGWPLEGVACKVGETTVATTDADGRFQFLWPLGRRTGVRFVLDGYAADVKPVRMTVESPVAELFPVLVLRDTPQSLDAVAGGTIVGRAGARVVVPPAALVRADGTPVTEAVNVYLTPINYADPNGFSAFPGLADARTESGEAVWMESFGVVELDIRLGDEPVFLAAGETATLTIPISTPNDGRPNGSEVGLWGLDPETGLWTEAGIASVSSVSSAPANRGIVVPVSRLGWWNADVGVVPQAVNLRVVTRSGETLTDVDADWNVSTSFVAGAGRGRLQVTRPVRPVDGTGRIDIPTTGAFEIQVVVPASARVGVLQVADAAEAPDLLVVELGPPPRVIELEADVEVEVNVAQDEFLLVQAIVPEDEDWGLREQTSGVRLERWAVQPFPETRATSVPANFTRWLPLGGQPEAPTVRSFLYRSLGSGTVRWTAQTPAAFPPLIDEDTLIELGSNPVQLPFVARQGTWLRATAVWDDDFTGALPSISILNGGGTTVNGFGASVGDTGGVRLPESGVYVVRASGSAPARPARIRVVALPPPRPVAAGVEWAETVDLVRPGDARMWVVPLAVGHVVDALVRPSDPETASLAGRIAVGGLPLNGWNSFSTIYSPQVIQSNELPAASTARRLPAHNLATAFVYAALAPTITGVVDVRINSLPPSAAFTVGERAECPEATTSSLTGAALALTAGGTITLCGEQIDGAHGRVIPHQGTVVGSEAARPTVRPWSGRGMTLADPGTPFAGTTMRHFNVFVRGSVTGFAPGLVLPSAAWTVEMTDMLWSSAGGFWAIEVAPSTSPLATLRLRNLDIEGFSNGVQAGRLALVDIEDVRTEHRLTCFSLSGNTHTRVANVDATCTGVGITASNASNGSWEILNNRLDQSAGVNAGIFVGGNEPGTGPRIVSGNEVIVNNTTTTSAILVLRHPTEAIRVDANRVRSMDDTFVRNGIEIRDVAIVTPESAGPVTVTNNIVEASALQAISVGGADQPSGVTIAHNTLTGGGAFASRAALVQVTTRSTSFTGALPLVVQGNLFVGGGTTRDVAVQVPRAGVTFTAIRNATRNLALPYVIAGSSTAVDVGASDDVTADPLTLDADLCPIGAWPGRDAATQNATTPDRDIRGVSRPQGAGPDIGACEQ